jgi:hypothetical protein
VKRLARFFRRGRRRRLNSTICKELSDCWRGVGARQERAKRGFGKLRDRRLRGRRNLRIRIVGQEYQERKLLLRARSHYPFRREQPYFGRSFATPEEINQRRSQTWIHGTLKRRGAATLDSARSGVKRPLRALHQVGHDRNPCAIRFDEHPDGCKAGGPRGSYLGQARERDPADGKYWHMHAGAHAAQLIRTRDRMIRRLTRRREDGSEDQVVDAPLALCPHRVVDRVYGSADDEAVRHDGTQTGSSHAVGTKMHSISLSRPRKIRALVHHNQRLRSIDFAEDARGETVERSVGKLWLPDLDYVYACSRRASGTSDQVACVLIISAADGARCNETERRTRQARHSAV